MNLKEATNKKGKDKTIVFVLDMILEKCGKRNGKAIKTKENSLSDFKIICIYIYMHIYSVCVYKHQTANKGRKTLFPITTENVRYLEINL
jgi:hypothetical protein